MNGGKIYGEGFKGYVEDIKYIKYDHKTLYNYLINTNTNNVKLYGIRNGRYKTIIKKDKLIKLIKNNNNLLVKCFKNDLWFIMSKTFNFKNELTGFYELIKIFGNKIKDYTTILPLANIDNIDIYGLNINRRYFTFTEKCNITLENMKLDEKLFKQLINNITEILLILRKNKYIHNDLKPDNMMYCHNRFKLIDWELSRPIRNKSDSIRYNGTLVFNHPIKLYIKGFPEMICKNIINISILYIEKIKWLRKIKSFEIYKKRTIDSFDRIINLNLSRKKIHKIFTKYFDAYSFALSLAFLSEKNNLEVPHKIIDKLMRPLEYPKSIYHI